LESEDGALRIGLLGQCRRGTELSFGLGVEFGGQHRDEMSMMFGGLHEKQEL